MPSRQPIEPLLVLLETLSLAISDAHDLDEGLAHVVESTCRTMAWKSGRAWLFSAEGALVASRGSNADSLDVAALRALVTAAAVRREAQWSHGDAVTVAIPLLAGASAVGALSFDVTASDDAELGVTLVSVVAAHLGQWLSRKRAQDQLRETEERFRLLVEHVRDAILMIDPDGHVQTWSPAAERLLGYSAAEAIGQRIAQLHLATILDPQERQETEWWVRKDGTRIWAHVVTCPIRDAHQRITGFAMVVRDLTMEKAAAEALSERSILLERSNRELEQFAGIAAHDLQEPLRKIRAFSDRLRLRSSSALEEASISYLTVIESAALRMQHLIDDLLVYARVATRRSLEEVVDLQRLAEDVVRDLGDVIEREQASVEVLHLPTIRGAKPLLRQLLQNLIANALKFHAKGRPPTIRVSSQSLDASAGVPRIELAVEDDGIGFDPKHAERIFNMLQRLHGRGQYEGTGMGLAICRRIAERHDGSIRATSAPDQGATFIVTLPVHGGAHD